jgi:hypothetical protein
MFKTHNMVNDDFLAIGMQTEFKILLWHTAIKRLLTPGLKHMFKRRVVECTGKRVPVPFFHRLECLILPLFFRFFIVLSNAISLIL